MSRFLIASWDGGGNATPAYHLGTRLVRRGHQVRMLGWQPMAARAAAAGVEFAVYPTVPRWPDGVAHDDDWDLLCECLFGAACRSDVADEAVAFDADALVVDCMLRGGLAAAADLGMPAAALVHVSYRQFVGAWGHDVMGTDVRAMLAPCAAVLALQPPGFDEPGLLPAGHEYVGAILAPEPRADAALVAALAEPGDPWVLVSLSTTDQAGQRVAVQAILEALAQRRVRVLVTLAGAVAREELRVPANATACGFVPHEAVLPHVAAVVTHAGMSTVTAALAAGVPMVCVPQGRDQGNNAARVAALGAGVVVDVQDAGAAVDLLQADPAFRTAARRVANAAAGLGGGTRAVDLVEALASAQPSSSSMIRTAVMRCTG
jgi:UDP:flavonoid glycosyltransferase YjiC (YdhE family)